jgi:hypothetical protein
MRRWQIRKLYKKYRVVETTNIEPHQYAAGVEVLPTKYYNRLEAKIAQLTLEFENNNYKAKEELEHMQKTLPEYFL